MKSSILLLLCSLFLARLINCESSTTEVKSVTKADTTELHAKLIKLLTDGSEFIQHGQDANEGQPPFLWPKTTEETSTGEKVFNHLEVNAQGRSFSFNVLSAGNVCSFGPVFTEAQQPVYYRKRALTLEEEADYKRFGRSSRFFIVGLGPGEGVIRDTRTSWYEGRYGTISPKTSTTTYDIASPIESVFFTCEGTDFCCGLFCCSREVQSFLRKTIGDSASDKEAINSTAALDEFHFSTDPHVTKANMAGMEQCELVLGSDDYYQDKKNVTSVYYQCHKTECCTSKLCCLKPVSTDATFPIALFCLIAFVFAVGFASMCYLSIKGRNPSMTKMGKY